VRPLNNIQFWFIHSDQAYSKPKRKLLICTLMIS
jgi:hypothetical protein